MISYIIFLRYGDSPLHTRMPEFYAVVAHEYNIISCDQVIGIVAELRKSEGEETDA